MDIARINQIRAYKIVKPITIFISQIEGLSANVREKRLTNRKIHDLTALFYVHYTYIESEGIKYDRYEELKNLLKRSKRMEHAYNKQDALKAVYRYFELLVAFIS